MEHKLSSVTDILEYNSIKDNVERFIQPDHGKFLNVISIDKIINLKLEEKFLKRQKTMIGYSQETTKLKFHGTNEDALMKIIEEGFQLPKVEGMYGLGIYFATDSSKSAQYVGEKCKLLLCEVALGKSIVFKSANHSLNLEILTKMGYDSVYAPRNTQDTSGVKFDEFIIYHPYQAIPRYLIHYSEKKIDQKSNFVLEGSVLWKKHPEGKWHKRYAYLLSQSTFILLKNKESFLDTLKNQKNLENEFVPQVSIEISSIQDVQVYENENKNLIIIYNDKKNQKQNILLSTPDAYNWMEIILSCRLKNKKLNQSMIDHEKEISQDDKKINQQDQINFSEYEKNKNGRKKKVLNGIEEMYKKYK